MLRRSKSLKSSRLKERRRKIIIGKVSVALFFAGGLWLFVFWLSGLPAMTIKSVEIRGAVSVPSSAIASSTEKVLAGSYFFTVPRANILFYPRARIEKSILDDFPRLERVRARFKNFNAIAVTVTEREAEALWCTPAETPILFLGEQWDDCYLMDANGFIFHELDLTSFSSPDAEHLVLSNRFPVYIKFYGSALSGNPVGQSYEMPERFRALLAFARNIELVGPSVLAFRERPDKDLEVSVLGGARLIVSRDADLDSVFANLQTIIADPDFGVGAFNKVDYIDMRFGNKVFYKLK